MATVPASARHSRHALLFCNCIGVAVLAAFGFTSGTCCNKFHAWTINRVVPFFLFAFCFKYHFARSAPEFFFHYIILFMKLFINSNTIIYTKKINLFAPSPKGSKLIFNTPFRAGANVENLYTLKYIIKI